MFSTVASQQPQKHTPDRRSSLSSASLHFGLRKSTGQFSEKNISEWTKEDLVEWAKSYKYEDAPEKFLQNDWDGQCLIYVTIQDLLDIGIKKGEAKSIETRLKPLLQKDRNIHISSTDISFTRDLLFGPNIQ